MSSWKSVLGNSDFQKIVQEQKGTFIVKGYGGSEIELTASPDASGDTHIEFCFKIGSERMAIIPLVLPRNGSGSFDMSALAKALEGVQ